MKIAVIAPSPIPYVRGGIENLVQGLCSAINSRTSHTAEMIKIPVREDGFFRILHAYFKFYCTQLSHFDVIISIKYPAWMIRHPRHIIYLSHRLRGLYDTYHLAVGHPDLLAFPGPLIRRIVHFLDNIAINPKRIAGMFAISRTVAMRPDYAHPELPAEVVYPPPLIETFRCGKGKHFFTASRLDAPKRVDLLIQAYQLADTHIPFIIAGDGPQMSYLRLLAGNAANIVFTGEVSNDRLRELYAESIAVLYSPFAEDYGYITIEAMKSGKPVITTTDSGGPLEFVRAGETGLIADPSPESIAEKIRFILRDPDKAREMGKRGAALVRDITWDNALQQLIGFYDAWPERSEKPVGARRRLLALVPYPVHPPRSGGQRRVAAIYAQLSRVYDVWILSLNREQAKPTTIRINPWLHEIIIPPSQAHLNAQWQLEKEAGVAVSDAAIPLLLRLTPQYLATLDYFTRCSDIIVSCQPYFHPFIRPGKSTRCVVHDSQNFEWELKFPGLAHTATGRKLLKQVRKCESEAVRKSDILFVTSKKEGEQLCGQYGRTTGNVFPAPNGVDTGEVCPAQEAERKNAREKFGVGDRTVALFIGAWHLPNLEAFRFILDTVAPRMKHIVFLVIGSVQAQYAARIGALPALDNLLLLGEVDEETRLQALAAADIALNPMFSGSGTNLKALEYCAAGLCVVSTPLGIRGLKLRHGETVILADQKNFCEKLHWISQDAALRRKIGANARRVMETEYSWSHIAEDMIQAIEKSLPQDHPLTVPMHKDQYFPYGWYPVENWGSAGNGSSEVRWSGPRAQFLVPDVRCPARVRMKIQAKTGGAHVAIRYKDTIVFQGKIPDTFREVTFQAPYQPGYDLHRFALETEKWSPADHGSPDRRTLGVAVALIRVERA